MRFYIAIYLFLNAFVVADFFDQARMENAPIFKNNTKGVLYAGLGGGVSVYNIGKFSHIGEVRFGQNVSATLLFGYKNIYMPLRHEMSLTYIDRGTKPFSSQLSEQDISGTIRGAKYYLFYHLLFETGNIFDLDYDVGFFFGPGIGAGLTQSKISISSTTVSNDAKIIRGKNGLGLAFDFSLGASIKIADLWRGQVKLRYIGDNESFAVQNFGNLRSQTLLLELGIIFKAG